MTDDNLQAETPAEGAPALPDANADTAAPPTATDEATGSPADDAGEEPKRNSVGARIDELTGKWRSTERERDYWRELALRNQTAEQPPEPPKPAASNVPKEPTLEEHGWDEAKFKAAYIDYTKAVARAEAEAVIAAREREAAERARLQSFKQKEAEFKASAPDYESVAYFAPISNQVAEIIRDSEAGPELAYYLGKNPDLARSISQLPERQAAHALGVIAGELRAEKKAKAAPPPVVSKAPPPPPKVEATEPAVEKDPSQMSDAEWYRYSKRLANLKQNQRKR